MDIVSGQAGGAWINGEWEWNRISSNSHTSEWLGYIRYSTSMKFIKITFSVTDGIVSIYSLDPKYTYGTTAHNMGTNASWANVLKAYRGQIGTSTHNAPLPSNESENGYAVYNLVITSSILSSGMV